MIENEPVVSIGDILISALSYRQGAIDEVVGLVVNITKEKSVYVRSNYIYTILWSDYPEPLEHTEDAVRRWRELYHFTRKQYGL